MTHLTESALPWILKESINLSSLSLFLINVNLHLSLISYHTPWWGFHLAKTLYFSVTASRTEIHRNILKGPCDLTPLGSEREAPCALALLWIKVFAMYRPDLLLFREQLKGTSELSHCRLLWMVSQPPSPTRLVVLCFAGPSERLWEPWNQCTSPSGWTLLKVQAGPSLVKRPCTIPAHSEGETRDEFWNAFDVVWWCFHLACETINNPTQPNELYCQPCTMKKGAVAESAFFILYCA